jgi:hypothetical protein
MEEINDMQRQFCDSKGIPFDGFRGSLKTGVALSTLGQVPWNGLRHPARGETSGWYIWCGEAFSEAPDFFASLHTSHIYEKYPELTKVMGMAPGYRFLLAHGYLDVWYDPSLLLP